MGKTLTVAVPSYNVEECIAEALASYVAAGVDDRLEVIVVNDGSTDSTSAIAHEFARLYPNTFRVIDKENGGHGSAVNAGIAAARGAYFRVIDGDDYICSENVARLLDNLDKCGEDLVLDLKREVNIVTGQSRRTVVPADIPRDARLPFAEAGLRADTWESFMIHSMCVRTDFLRANEISLLEHAFYVDYEYVVKICSQVDFVRFLDMEACEYHIGNDGQSVAPANYVRRWDDHSRVVEELLRFSRRANLDPVHRRFVDERVRLISETHYNIALIFDEDRAQGLGRARAFRAFLRESYPDVGKATEKRYRQALVLHFLGFDAERLEKLMGRG